MRLQRRPTELNLTFQRLGQHIASFRPEHHRVPGMTFERQPLGTTKASVGRRQRKSTGCVTIRIDKRSRQCTLSHRTITFGNRSEDRQFHTPRNPSPPTALQTIPPFVRSYWQQRHTSKYSNLVVGAAHPPRPDLDMITEKKRHNNGQ